jgi:two-component system response regulator TtrR
MPSMAQQSSTVFIVDDDVKMQNALLALVEAWGYAALAFRSGIQFCDYYRNEMPGCLLIDIHQPKQSGLELYAQWMQAGNRLPAIFMVAQADVSMAVAAMKFGAMEFLEKPVEHEVLADRLQRALTLDSQWRERDARFVRAESKMSKLTVRERETLQLIVEGCPNKAMASRFDLTERAIEMRRARIMRKLDVRSFAELLDVAVTYRVLSELREVRQRI